jgi:hypothetical protein
LKSPPSIIFFFSIFWFLFFFFNFFFLPAPAKRDPRGRVANRG